MCIKKKKLFFLPVLNLDSPQFFNEKITHKKEEEEEEENSREWERECVCIGVCVYLYVFSR